MHVLDSAATDEKLKKLAEWKLENGEIVRHFTFANFVDAMRFVNAVAEMAEGAGHHPDIDIRYNKVRLALVSHDAGGLTESDFGMAAAIDQLPTKN
jgi:4a-hydroxytetrahydrobiopterin dehydratase